MDAWSGGIGITCDSQTAICTLPKSSHNETAEPLITWVYDFGNSTYYLFIDEKKEGLIHASRVVDGYTFYEVFDYSASLLAESTWLSLDKARAHLLAKVTEKLHRDSRCEEGYCPSGSGLPWKWDGGYEYGRNVK